MTKNNKFVCGHSENASLNSKVRKLQEIWQLSLYTLNLFN